MLSQARFPAYPSLPFIIKTSSINLTSLPYYVSQMVVKPGPPPRYHRPGLMTEHLSADLPLRSVNLHLKCPQAAVFSCCQADYRHLPTSLATQVLALPSALPLGQIPPDQSHAYNQRIRAIFCGNPTPQAVSFQTKRPHANPCINLPPVVLVGICQWMWCARDQTKCE